MEVNVYVKGTPLLKANEETGNDELVGYSVDQIRDTTKNGELSVYWSGKVVGSAIRMRTATIDDIPHIVYDVELKESLNPDKCCRLLGGYVGTVSGAMWVRGLFPQKITITRAPSHDINQFEQRRFICPKRSSIRSTV